MDVVLAGCGYTASRVALRLLAAGARVHGTARDPSRLAPLAAAGLRGHALDAEDPRSVAALAAAVPAGAAVLWSAPPPAPLAPLLAALAPARVVYVSSTSVYGDATLVDERTAPAPRTEADRARLLAEAAALGGPWSGLVLRPAAIYGPGRGLHASIAAGRAPPVDPDRPGSRVHVDDLAALCAAALGAAVEGAFPVADDEPAAAREVAAFCASLGLPRVAWPAGATSPFGSRRVDGRAIRAVLGVALRFPTFREGIPAALAEEGRGA